MPFPFFSGVGQEYTFVCSFITVLVIETNSVVKFGDH